MPAAGTPPAVFCPAGDWRFAPFMKKKKIFASLSDRVGFKILQSKSIFQINTPAAVAPPAVFLPCGRLVLRAF
jgi:hypothetical protein